jgi:hypothetical protein
LINRFDSRVAQPSDKSAPLQLEVHLRRWRWQYQAP